MEYVPVPYTTHLEETIAALSGPGMFLVSAGHDGYLNAMIIGWGTVGTIWSKPIFVVMVRPSRFTYGLLDETKAFTACVPGPHMQEAVDFCGSKSGRSYRKFEELGLVPVPSTQIAVPGIAGCPLIYECQVLHTNDLLPDRLAADVQGKYYPGGDYHRVYFGEILAVRRLSEG